MHVELTTATSRLRRQPGNRRLARCAVGPASLSAPIAHLPPAAGLPNDRSQARVEGPWRKSAALEMFCLAISSTIRISRSSRASASGSSCRTASFFRWFAAARSHTGAAAGAGSAATSASLRTAPNSSTGSTLWVEPGRPIAPTLRWSAGSVARGGTASAPTVDAGARRLLPVRVDDGRSLGGVVEAGRHARSAGRACAAARAPPGDRRRPDVGKEQRAPPDQPRGQVCGSRPYGYAPIDGRIASSNVGTVNCELSGAAYHQR